jgi:hypothetical protein
MAWMGGSSDKWNYVFSEEEFVPMRTLAYGNLLILKNWLGGLDSNQDSQSQSLESYQLDDLPAGRNRNESQHVRLSRQPRFNLSNLIGNAKSVNQTAQLFAVRIFARATHCPR